MATTMAVEIERAQKRGDRKLAKFEGAVRSLENIGLEKGDVFTIPATFEVYEQKFGDTGKAQYIFVEVENNGVKTVKPFYPSTMTKTRAIYNEDGTPTGSRMSTKGTAAEEFRNHGGVQEAMEALAGKTLVVSNIETVRTLRFGTTSLMDAQIPTIDLK